MQVALIGFWCCLPLFVVVACAVVITFPWANNLVYRVSGNEPPKASAGQQPGAPGQGNRGGTPNGSSSGTANVATVDTTNLNDLCARAERKTLHWQTVSLRLPKTSDPAATFSIDAGNGGQPAKRAQLTLSRTTGDEVRWEPFESNNRGRRWRMWIRFAHTGEVFGLAGQTIAGIAALGGAFLVYTGIALAIRRFLAWRARTDNPTETRIKIPAVSE